MLSFREIISMFITLIEKINSKQWIKTILYILIAGLIIVFSTKYGFLEYNKKLKELNDKEHVYKYEEAKKIYSYIKGVMHDYLKLTNSDYILLVEYHNGAENIITNIPFCRFDITVEVLQDDVPYISTDNFRNDLISRYDILSHHELITNNILYINKYNCKKYDRLLDLKLKNINANEFVIKNLKNDENQVFASLIFITLNNKKINIQNISLCSIYIESIMLKKPINKTYEY